jgi:hypothetical protein
VADIEQDGPFSPFPEVQRWFAVLEGEGVALNFADREEMLRPGSAPIVFDGALAPGCRLLSGPTRDLNLMARQDAGVAKMQVAHRGDTLGDGRGNRPPRWRGVYAASPLTLALEGGSRLPLPAGSLAWSELPQGSWQLEAAAGTALRAWWLQLEAHA